jgi:hypothetical protein
LGVFSAQWRPVGRACLRHGQRQLFGVVDQAAHVGQDHARLALHLGFLHTQETHP